MKPSAVDTLYVTDTIGVRIFFHQSKVNLIPTYQHNKERLDTFLANLRALEKDTLLRFRKVNIVGGASPEGTKRFNKWLSEQRAGRITDYVLQRFPLDRSLISWEYPGVDWLGLKRYILTDPDMPDRDEVLAIIDNPGPDDDRVEKLKTLDFGTPWTYMYNKFYPPLRGSQVQIIFDKPSLLPRPAPSPARLDLKVPIVLPKIPLVHIDFEPEPEPDSLDIPFYMALKTNLLYDALLIPNIGVDVYMGRNWSAVINWEYAWWKSDAVHWYWRCYGGDFELRRWFGKAAKEKPLTGHHVGPYFQIVTYDFELGHRGYQARRWTKAAGISYGYTMPLTRRFNLEFEIGLGYAWGHFYEYDPIDDHYVWQATTRRRYFGPTKIEISLAYLIGHNNYNRRKPKQINKIDNSIIGKAKRQIIELFGL